MVIRHVLNYLKGMDIPNIGMFTAELIGDVDPETMVLGPEDRAVFAEAILNPPAETNAASKEPAKMQEAKDDVANTEC
jgi:hypothetical protein